jgi:hypothetical protein
MCGLSASQQNYECGVVFLQFSQICSPEPHIHKFATWPLTLIRHSQICSVNGAFTNLLVLSGREKKCTAYPRPRSTPAYGAVRLSVDLWASDTRFDCWGCWPAGACGCSCSSSSSMTATSALIASSSRLNSWRPTARSSVLRCRKSFSRSASELKCECALPETDVVWSSTWLFVTAGNSRSTTLGSRPPPTTGPR